MGSKANLKTMHFWYKNYQFRLILCAKSLMIKGVGVFSGMGIYLNEYSNISELKWSLLDGTWLTEYYGTTFMTIAQLLKEFDNFFIYRLTGCRKIPGFASVWPPNKKSYRSVVCWRTASVWHHGALSNLIVRSMQSMEIIIIIMIIIIITFIKCSLLSPEQPQRHYTT